MADKVSKPIANVLYDWATFNEYGDNRMRGRALFDQPKAMCERGGYLITSPLERVYTDNGVTVAETRNSLYILA